MEWKITIPFQRETSERFIEVKKVDSKGIDFGRYYLSPAELIQALLEFNKKNSPMLTMPLLPENCIHFTRSHDERLIKIILSSPKAERLVKYGDNECYFIEVPKTVMVIDLEKDMSQYKFLNTRLFAVIDEAISDKTVLHAYPFPNVDKSGGRICWGGNRLKQISCLTQLNQINEAFYAAPFGEDYGMRLLSGFPSFKKYLLENDGKPFNDQELISKGMVLADLI